MEEVGVEDETRQHCPIGRDGERVFSVEESADHQTDREREDGAEEGRVRSVVEVRTHLLRVRVHFTIAYTVATESERPVRKRQRECSRESEAWKRRRRLDGY